MMNCPSCGAVMVWLNGSIAHDTPIRFYECRQCRISVTKYEDGSFETKPFEETKENSAQQPAH